MGNSRLFSSGLVISSAILLAACGSTPTAGAPTIATSASPTPSSSPSNAQATATATPDLPPGAADVEVSGAVSGSLTAPILVECLPNPGGLSGQTEIDVNGTFQGVGYAMSVEVTTSATGTTSATFPSATEPPSIVPSVSFGDVNGTGSPSWGPEGTTKVTVSNGGKSGQLTATLVGQQGTEGTTLDLAASWTCP